MADLGGTKVISPVRPTDSADVFATHEEKYGQGGYRTVGTIAERDAIPALRRKRGMLVQVVDSDGNGKRTFFVLGAGLLNSDWTEALLDKATINALLAGKADQSALEATNQVVAQKAGQSDLDATNQTLAQKANQADLDQTNTQVQKNTTDIAGKAPLNHAHGIDDITGLDDFLSQKAPQDLLSIDGSESVPANVDHPIPLLAVSVGEVGDVSQTNDTVFVVANPVERPIVAARLAWAASALGTFRAVWFEVTRSGGVIHTSAVERRGASATSQPECHIVELLPMDLLEGDQITFYARHDAGIPILIFQTPVDQSVEQVVNFFVTTRQGPRGKDGLDGVFNIPENYLPMPARITESKVVAERALSISPTIDLGVTVSVAPGARWVIL